jgi:copper(I)-binding protein
MSTLPVGSPLVDQTGAMHGSLAWSREAGQQRHRPSSRLDLWLDHCKIKSAVLNKESIARACCRSTVALFLLAGSLVVRDAWVRESLRPGGSSAAYLTLENPTPQPITITGITVDGARRAEVHAMTGPATSATMQRIATLVVPAHGSVHLQPGGTHVMLFGVDPAYTVGRSVALTVSIDHQPAHTVQAVVRPLEATAIR